jgi:hypothetical protein
MIEFALDVRPSAEQAIAAARASAVLEDYELPGSYCMLCTRPIVATREIQRIKGPGQIGRTITLEAAIGLIATATQLRWEKHFDRLRPSLIAVSPIGHTIDFPWIVPIEEG